MEYVQEEEGLLGDKGVEEGDGSLGICNKCETGLLGPLDAEVRREGGLEPCDPCKGGVGRAFGGRPSGASLKSPGENCPLDGENGGVCTEPSGYRRDGLGSGLGVEYAELLDVNPEEAFERPLYC